MRKIIGVLVVAAVMLAIATVSWAAVGSSGPPPGLKWINSSPDRNGWIRHRGAGRYADPVSALTVCGWGQA